MTKKKKIKLATDDIIARIKERFPEAKVKGVIEWMNADAAIEVETPTDNGWEISEFTAPIQTDYAMKWNISITVLPLEKIDGFSQT
ncbi:hypothetical protein GWO43_19455 [candidate division KSB1 bacterium]|nr:hypothetical protein [candidate division KSB1 bacterium]NIR71371.1 hypothetical protein [candidate division KSB1 bacterium]NIS26260.1 hypothetical protein [candidate division KSB1 bacterium]NIT73012.1 hypothetical protein [candidate division KSB1 bacterium]NIU26909.1 hypothetical protein [candidate division KSB1 bacterium]